MATTCLLHNNRTCTEKQRINGAKSDGRIRIVYAYEWSTCSGNRALVRDEVKSVVNEVKKVHPLRFSFSDLSGKDGSVYCDICRQIRSADVGLFDVSTNNLNVILELGLAIGTGMTVFMLRSTQYRRSADDLSDVMGIFEHRFYRRKTQLRFKANFQRSLKSKLLLTAKKKHAANLGM